MSKTGASANLTRIKIDGLDCSGCTWNIERTLSREGIDCSFDPAASVLDVRSKDAERALKIIRRASPGTTFARNHNDETAHRKNKIRQRLWLVLASAVLLGAALLLDLFLPQSMNWLPFAVLIGSYLVAGSRVLLRTFRSILVGRLFDENSLMTIATVSALIIGKPFEAIAVMLFYSVGELFQKTATYNSREAIENLIGKLPEHANLRVEGRTVQVPAEDISIGSELLVKPGERIPIDGTVKEGRARVDVASLTGEPVPVDVKPGDKVLSGSINADGILTIVTGKTYADSAFQKIISLTAAAAGNKSKTEKTLRKFARVYTPLVVLAAVGLAFIPPLVLGASLYDWIYRSLVLLVISCPCAMLISVPLTYFSGLGGASRKGILAKGAHALEAASRVTKVVFDKTGTLTDGELRVCDVISLNGYSSAEIVDLVVLAAAHSNHPIARAIRSLSDSTPQTERVSDYFEHAGFGIIASIDDKQVVLGSVRLFEREGIPSVSDDSGDMTVYLAVNNYVAASIRLSDTVKKDSYDTVRALKEIGISEVIILTGDRQAVARRVSEEIGADRVIAEVLPQDKLSVVEKLLEKTGRSSKGTVMVVGDGINDAPSIMRSDVGVAMGCLGSDAAIEAADVVITDDRPSKVYTTIVHARKTRRIVIQNIVLALGIKTVFLVLGAAGIATMWQAIFADVGVALITISNAVRAFKITT